MSNKEIGGLREGNLIKNSVVSRQAALYISTFCASPWHWVR